MRRVKKILEALMKKRFWLFHAFFLLLCAFLLAGVANQYAASKIADSLSASSGKASMRSKTARSTNGRPRDFASASDKNIFLGKRDKVQKSEGSDEIECEERSDCPDGMVCGGSAGDEKRICMPSSGAHADYANAVESELRLRVVGLAAFSLPEESYSTIMDMDGSSTDVYAPVKCNGKKPKQNDDEDGNDDEDEKQNAELDESNYSARPMPCRDLPGGHELLRIDYDRVYLQNSEEGRTEFLLLDDQRDLKASKRKKKKKDKDEDDSEVGKGIKKVGDSSWEITQGELDGAMGNMAKLATQARVVPAFEGGKPVGFKLFSIRRKSLYNKIGLKNGDIIKSINGFDMSDMTKAMSLLPKLQTEKSFTVDIKRRGKAKTLEYSVVK